MQDSQLRRRAAVVALGALTVGSLSYAVAATGAPRAASTAGECRASTARVMLAGENVLEPFVADDCKGEDVGVINPTTSVGPIDLRVLYASTHPAYPNAEAGVADVSAAGCGLQHRRGQGRRHLRQGEVGRHQLPLHRRGRTGGRA